MGSFATGAWRTNLTVIAYVFLLSLINELGGLPISFYSGFAVERRYGLSNESLRAWALDRVKSFTLGLVLGGAAAVLIYALIRVSSERWWLTAGVLFAAIVVGLTNMALVLLLPLFY